MIGSYFKVLGFETVKNVLDKIGNIEERTLRRRKKR